MSGKGISDLGAGIVFNTDHFPAGDRFEAFCGTVEVISCPVVFSTSDPEAFACELAIKPIGGLFAARARITELVAAISPAGARGAEDMLAVQLYTSGEVDADQGRHVTIGGGGGIAAPNTAAGELHYTNGSAFDWLVLGRDRLQPLLRDHWPGNACADLSVSPAFHLLRCWVAAALEPGACDEPGTAQVFEKTTIDLLALILGARGEERQLVLGRGVRAAVRHAVLGELKRRAAAPGVNAVEVARKLGITDRYVHRLLEETGKTFSEHVLEERLRLAFAMLAVPATRGRKITEIASAAGFTDISYFNRTFRRRFGEKPSTVRARAAEVANGWLGGTRGPTL